MRSGKMSWLSSIVVAVTGMLSLHSICEGRYFREYGLSWTPDTLIPNDYPIEDESLNYPFSTTIRSSRIKRRIFDSDCKGIYNRDAIEKLDGVCDACYNLYRKPYIATQCRKDCFNNGVFESCLYDLMMHDVANEYTSMVRAVGK